MTEPDDSDSRTDLQREALARVHRLVSGEATIAEVAEAKRWRRISRDHDDAFAAAARMWDRLGPAGRNVLARQGPDRALRASMAPARPSRRLALGGGAALAAAGLYLAVRPPLELWPSVAELTADYRTSTGERRQVALAGNASVELNTQTSLALRPAEEVELISGEAAFDTGGSPKAPLTVIVGNGRIRAQVARFNVRYDGDASCRITCLEGLATVERQGTTRTLEAGGRIAYAAAGLGFQEKIDTASVGAWQEGLLVFRQTPLSEVVAEINRYRPGKIVLLNAELGRRPVNARFRIDGVEEIMTLARSVFGAKTRSLPGGIILVS